MSRVLLASLSSLIVAAANGQLLSNFESPAFAASVGGTPVNGQSGWYTPPIAGSIDQLVYTYAANARGLAANPQGGSQFMGGRSDGGTSLARAQHDVDFSVANVWTLTLDFACNFDGVLPATPNLASFSLNNSTGVADFKQYVTLHNFVDVNNPAAGWMIEYNISNAAGLGLSNQSPGPSWTNLTFNHWYRESTTVDFSTNRIVSVSITDLTTNTTTTATPDWYMAGGTAVTLQLPPSIRCFVGGSTAGSIAGFDNISVTVVCTADFNHDDVVDLFDYLDFVQAFSSNDPSSDFNHDDVVDLFDYLDFVQAFSSGC